jgi:hypothetical protein
VFVGGGRSRETSAIRRSDKVRQGAVRRVGRLKSEFLCRFRNKIGNLALILLARFVDFCVVAAIAVDGCIGCDELYEKRGGNFSSNSKLQSAKVKTVEIFDLPEPLNRAIP